MNRGVFHDLTPLTLPPPALGVLLASVDPAKSAVLPVLPVLGISPGAFSCFMLFWLVNMAVDGQGIDCIRWIEALRAPLLLAAGFGELAWAWMAGDGFGPMLSQSSNTVQ